MGDALEMTHFFDFFEFWNLQPCLSLSSRGLASPLPKPYKESSVQGLFPFFFQADRLLRCSRPRRAERRGRARLRSDDVIFLYIPSVSAFLCTITVSLLSQFWTTLGRFKRPTLSPSLASVRSSIVTAAATAYSIAVGRLLGWMLQLVKIARCPWPCSELVQSSAK